MTNQQILEIAMLRAHMNGWKPLNSVDFKNVEVQQWQGNGMVGIALLYSEGDAAVKWVRELEGIIYNHDFAKALWGEDKSISVYPAPSVTLPKWKYHLQQMVIAEDPVKYLGKNI